MSQKSNPYITSKCNTHSKDTIHRNGVFAHSPNLANVYIF